MKIGQLFLPQGSYLTANREIRSVPELVSISEADLLTPFLIFESPVRSPQFVAFIVRPQGTAAEFSSTVIDLSANLDGQEIAEDGVVLEGSVIRDPAPLHWQLLLKNAARDWQPFTKPGAVFQDVANVWANQPRIYDDHLDRRKSPGLVTRQNSFIILAWGAWEREHATVKERVADMERQGYGILPPKTFEKRTKRLFTSVK